MATYAVSESGTALSLEASAYIPGDPFVDARSMSVSTFNTQQTNLVAGDVVYFDTGLTSTVAITQGGTEELPIWYRGTSDSSRCAITTTLTSACLTVAGNHIRVRYFNGTQTGTADCFCVLADSGKQGGGYSVKILDCTAMDNNGDGDGFAMNSTASDDSEAEFIRCISDDITGAGDQGFTHHENQRMRLTDCETTTNCETGIAPVGAYLEVNGGTFTCDGNAQKVVSASSCECVFNEATLTAPAGTSELVDFQTSTPGTSMTFNQCTLTANGGTVSFLRNADDLLDINGGTLTLNAADPAFETLNNGTIRVRGGCRVTATTIGSGVFQAINNGNFICESSIFDFSGSDAGTLFDMRTPTSGSEACQVSGCLFIGSSTSQIIVFAFLSGCVANFGIYNNTFVGFTGGSSRIVDDNTVSATADIRAFNNIFDDCDDAFDGLLSVTKDYNVYSNGTPDESDASGLTADPQFVDAGSENYRLITTSLAYKSGSSQWNARPLGLDGVPFPDLLVNRGCYAQAETDPFRPQNL
jgi:hypothetical protein